MKSALTVADIDQIIKDISTSFAKASSPVAWMGEGAKNDYIDICLAKGWKLCDIEKTIRACGDGTYMVGEGMGLKKTFE